MENRSGKIENRIRSLREEIEKLRYRYHVLNDPETTDETYTSLRHELLELEKKHPEFKIPNSPTDRIAGVPLPKFQKTAHLVRQWSLDDAFSFEELRDWKEKNVRLLDKARSDSESLDFLVEPKIDGLHIVLTYEKGILVRGATRGDGKIGEDVTGNIKTIESIPLTLKKEVDVVVEGECWLSHNELRRINKIREKNGEVLFANSRNAAAGSIRQLDPRIAGERKLDSFIYDLFLLVPANFPFSLNKQIDKLEILKNLGFKVNPYYKHAGNLEEIEIFFNEFKKLRDSLPYGIDGLVVKINSLKRQETLGHTGKSPRFAVAYKFPAERTTTRVLDVQIQIGRTGALTPVAILKPVALSGSVVSRASLHNFDEIKRLDLKIFDTVVLQKAGDIIPEVVEVIKNLRDGSEKGIKIPSHCPVCGSRVEKRLLNQKKEEANFYCLNKKCFAQEKENLIHFASKNGFGIEGMGEKIVEKLMESGLIQEFSDIFKVREEDLTPLERFAELSAKNLISSIGQSKKIKMEKFLASLGIRHVGAETAFLIGNVLEEKLFPQDEDRPLVEIGPDKLFETAQKNTLADWKAIKGIGEKAGESLFKFFHDKNNSREFLNLNRLEVKILLAKKSPENIKKKFDGKTFVFTGTLSLFPRNKAKDLVREEGGSVSESVSSKTDFLVAGENPGSKLKKAKKLGVTVLSEEEFKNLI